MSITGVELILTTRVHRNLGVTVLVGYMQWSPHHRIDCVNLVLYGRAIGSQCVRTSETCEMKSAISKTGRIEAYDRSIAAEQDFDEVLHFWKATATGSAAYWSSGLCKSSVWLELKRRYLRLVSRGW